MALLSEFSIRVAYLFIILLSKSWKHKRIGQMTTTTTKEFASIAIYTWKKSETKITCKISDITPLFFLDWIRRWLVRPPMIYITHLDWLIHRAKARNRKRVYDANQSLSSEFLTAIKWDELERESAFWKTEYENKQTNASLYNSKFQIHATHRHRHIVDRLSFKSFFQ